MAPLAMLGFLRRIWKVIAPPRLMPDTNTFKFGYFDLVRMMNCSLVLTKSSKD